MRRDIIKYKYELHKQFFLELKYVQIYLYIGTVKWPAGDDIKKN